VGAGVESAEAGVGHEAPQLVGFVEREDDPHECSDVVTGDPVDDLVAVGVPVFRSLALDHPALYRIAFQRIVPDFRAGPEVTAARTRAFAGLLSRVEPLKEAGLLGRKSVQEAAVEYNAMLEGLANAELRGGVLPNLPAGSEERAWRTRSLP
jgi:Tetracyclin repressor-like, C-terminal domain